MSVAAFIACQRTEYGVPHAVSCRALGLSESWFYKWRERLPTARQVRRAELADKIREFFDASGGTYGSPRITLDLWAAGYRVSENTVARLMAELGLAGRTPRRRRSLTRPGKRPTAPDRAGASSPPSRRTCSGAATSLRSSPMRESFIWQRFWICSADGYSATPCPSTTTPTWLWPH